MTAEYVAYHAAWRPDAVSIVSDGREITYSELDRDIRAMSWAMRGLGLSHGKSIVVRCGNAYVHWLLLIASERLGIAAVSLVDDRDPELLAMVDLILTDAAFPVGPVRRHALTEDWIAAALSGQEAEVPPAPAPNDAVRIVSTSGTTGPAKRFLVRRGAQDARTAQWITSFNISRSSRYLVSIPLAMRGTFDCGCACLRAGGTIVLETRQPTTQALCTHTVSHLLVLPMHLRAILDELPADFPKPRDLTIVSFGGRIPQELRERATKHLATHLCETYGTSEVCTIGVIWGPDTDGFGTIPPRAQVEVLDERGNPLPIGRVGAIRVRTDAMCESYLGNPEATSRMFKDGWFYPGDLAVLRSGRQVKILGRADDILNIGGQKFLPTFLEELVLRSNVAADVAVSSMEAADGVDRVCVAIAQPRCADTELSSRVVAAFQDFQLGVIEIVKVRDIPRNANGKIERARLKATVTKAVSESVR